MSQRSKTRSQRIRRLSFSALVLLLVQLSSPGYAQTFNDVPTNHFAFTFIEIMFGNAVTAGCGNNNYCPDDPVTRAQMAVFVERGIHGIGYAPPAPTGMVFDDVAVNSFAASFIEQFFAEGITAGCGNNNFCPDGLVTRAQMAVFIERAIRGGGYSPPAATGTVFDDVGAQDFAASFIEQFFADGITSGCGNNNYCPNDSVTRAQMAVFIVRAFNLSQPTVDAGPDVVVEESVTIQMAGSGDPADGPVTFEWSQLSGPAVTIDDTSDPLTLVDVPDVPIMSSDAIVLQLKGTDAVGAMTTDTMSITVASTEFALFLADKEEVGTTELYTFDPNTNILDKLSGTLVTDGDVFDHIISPDRQWIVYRADQDIPFKFELYVAASNGSGITKVNAAMGGAADVEEFAWSADSARLIYSADIDQDGVTEVYVVDRDGANHTKINADVGMPATFRLRDIRYSPDGRYVSQEVVDLATGAAIGIDVHDTMAGGANSVRVNPALVANGAIRSYGWMPDSSRIVYMADETNDEQIELFTVLPDATGHVRVSGALPTGGDVSGFGAAADSSRIAYRADQDTDDITELYSVVPDGSGNLKMNGVLTAGGEVQSDFIWSPDSSQLAYLADQDTDDDIELYTVLANGTGNLRLNGAFPVGGEVAEFGWSPDSSLVFYSADDGFNGVLELYTVRPDATDNTKVSGALPTGGTVDTDVNFSPDSSLLAYMADQDAFDVFELFTVSPDGSGNVKVSGPMTVNGDVLDFEWSPDSSRILYRADQDTDGTLELYQSSPDGASKLNVSGPMVTGANVFEYRWSP